jgi:hypothetical protein
MFQIIWRYNINLRKIDNNQYRVEIISGNDKESYGIQMDCMYIEKNQMNLLLFGRIRDQLQQGFMEYKGLL